ncbi:3-oxoacyl-reductase [Rhizodiscina lignyota]|uniref:3-oxoacyl-reductase n=1 Tax=Rhizodiscina lignyota TaxID=1504668 RepID=A0A9P4IMF2_9PEZI|nr:3-oxoacyl-reductase [Rhizodiscina lignyota]
MSFAEQFKGRVVAITGAASGIGYATAQLLASRGSNLSLADLSDDGLKRAANEIQSKCKAEIFTYVLDVRDGAQVEEWIKQTVQRFGKLDGAANMAGQDIEECRSEWEFMLGVNVMGVVYCLRAQLKHLEQGRSIVNAGSIAGLIGRPKLSSYAASKHGVLGLTKSAAKEVGARGIRVNVICSGRINTPMSGAAQKVAQGVGGAGSRDTETISGVALGREGQPEEVAKLIAFLLSDEASYITGASYSIDGGWNC